MLFGIDEKSSFDGPSKDHHFKLYHDESIKYGYWHGMLLIPSNKRDKFYNVLKCYREKENYFHKISFKEINGPGQKFNLANEWLRVGIGFLRSKTNSFTYPVISWKDDSQYSKYVNLTSDMMGAKFILFRVKDEHKGMTYFSDKVCNIETTMRMGLKGGLHYLGSENKPIHIEKIHLDGFEHNRRHADMSRIVDRIFGLRNYCTFAKRDTILDDRSSNPTNPDHQEIVDCEFLALTDLLIGSFRVALSLEENKYKKKLSEHARLILERISQGRERMSNSRWSESFCLSECELVNNNWIFNDLELVIPTDVSQQESFDWGP